MDQKTPIHLLIRFSDRLLTDRTTVEEHQKIIDRWGEVWFGKMGQPVAQKALDMLNKQVEDHLQTNIYLIRGNRRKSTVFISDLIFASKMINKDDKYLVPSYYQELDILRFIKTWVKINNIREININDLSKLKVVNSVYPLEETLIRSSTGHFYIKEKKQ